MEHKVKSIIHHMRAKHHLPMWRPRDVELESMKLRGRHSQVKVHTKNGTRDRSLAGRNFQGRGVRHVIAP